MSEEITEQHMHKLREIGTNHAKAKKNLERLRTLRSYMLDSERSIPDSYIWSLMKIISIGR